MRWVALVVAAVVIVAGSAALGSAAESQWGGNTSTGSAAASPFRAADSTLGRSGSSSSGNSSASIDVDAIAASTNPAIVNIQTTLGDGEAAGTGMVITKSGKVLTNNHVIAGAEKIRVEIGVTGKTYSASVLGYDVADDVALLQLQDASNMKTITVDESSDVSVNDAVVAIGNAQGKFGTPTVVSGVVSDTAKTITAGDQAGSDSETLRDMIEVQADIQPGDSGGPLLNSSGQVIGINSAAESSGGPQFGFGSSSDSGTTAGVGYAIPIERALGIANQIDKNDESNGVYVGSQRAMLGVGLEADATQGSGYGSGGFGSDDGSGYGSQGGSSASNSDGSSGAAVAQVQSASAADSAGIAVGDTIVSVDGTDVSSSTELRTALEAKHPGDSVRITWIDSSGSTRHASVKLGAGPPA